MGCIIPPPMDITFARCGRIRVTPTASVSFTEWQNASALRRARMTLVATVPQGSASSRFRVWETLLTFCALFDLSISSITAEDVADYVLWRAATDMPGVPPPPRGVPVLGSSAMGDLASLRAHALDTGVLPEEVLYGHCITVILKRLSAGEKYDSVRKSPVSPEDIVRLLDILDDPRETRERKDIALSLITGWYFFMRVGELSGVDWENVTVKGGASPSVSVVLPRTKTSRGLAPLPVSRTCMAPVLIRAFKAYAQACGPLPNKGKMCPPVVLQKVMQDWFGVPPVRHGDTRPLPWSLRAGAATACYAAGMAPDRIMRLGRWASQVALMYAVLTPSVQARIYLDVAKEAWWAGA